MESEVKDLDTKETVAEDPPKTKKELRKKAPEILLGAILNNRAMSPTDGIHVIIETTSGTYSGLRTLEYLPGDFEYWHKGNQTIYWLMVPDLDPKQADTLLWSLHLGNISDISEEILKTKIEPIPLPQVGDYKRTASQLYAFVSTYRKIFILLERERIKKESMTPLERFQALGAIVGPLILILVLTFIMVLSIE